MNYRNPLLFLLLLSFIFILANCAPAPPVEVVKEALEDQRLIYLTGRELYDAHGLENVTRIWNDEDVELQMICSEAEINGMTVSGTVIMKWFSEEKIMYEFNNFTDGNLVLSGKQTNEWVDESLSLLSASYSLKNSTVSELIITAEQHTDLSDNSVSVTGTLIADGHHYNLELFGVRDLDDFALQF